jgi:hypothetical protein
MTSRNYADTAWKRTRLQILQRDGYRCQIRGPKCKIKATEVDHIVNVDDGGARLDPANLRAACKSCNVSKRNTEVAARARRARVGAPSPAPTPAPSDPYVRTSLYGSWRHDGTWGPTSRDWGTGIEPGEVGDRSPPEHPVRTPHRRMGR